MAFVFLWTSRSSTPRRWQMKAHVLSSLCWRTHRHTLTFHLVLVYFNLIIYRGCWPADQRTACRGWKGVIDAFLNSGLSFCHPTNPNCDVEDYRLHRQCVLTLSVACSMAVVKVGLTSARFTWIGVLQGLPAECLNSLTPSLTLVPSSHRDREPALERAFLTGHSGFLPWTGWEGVLANVHSFPPIFAPSHQSRCMTSRLPDGLRADIAKHVAIVQSRSAAGRSSNFSASARRARRPPSPSPPKENMEGKQAAQIIVADRQPELTITNTHIFTSPTKTSLIKVPSAVFHSFEVPPPPPSVARTSCNCFFSARAAEQASAGGAKLTVTANPHPSIRRNFPPNPRQNV